MSEATCRANGVSDPGGGADVFSASTGMPIRPLRSTETTLHVLPCTCLINWWLHRRHIISPPSRRPLGSLVSTLPATPSPSDRHGTPTEQQETRPVVEPHEANRTQSRRPMDPTDIPEKAQPITVRWENTHRKRDRSEIFSWKCERIAEGWKESGNSTEVVHVQALPHPKRFKHSVARDQERQN